MSDRGWPVEFRFGGLGGQGLVTLGAVLASAAAQQGLNVAASQSYGSRARGGATRSDVIVSAQAIDFPHVHHPDVLVVLAQEAYDLYAQEVCEQGLILADSFFVTPQEQQNQTQSSSTPDTGYQKRHGEAQFAGGGQFCDAGCHHGLYRLA